MSTIRRQSILSSGIVYFGFGLGILNTYLFTRQGGFTPAEYGLTTIFTSIAFIMYSCANLGMQGFVFKFYPYYDDNLPNKKNDMITLTLVAAVAGFILVVAGGLVFQNFFIRKFGEHSPELVIYYHWIFIFGFGLTIYSLLEAYAWQLKKSVFTNYLKEFQFRAFTTLLIVLFITKFLRSFDSFIKLYSFGYLIIAVILLSYLVIKKEIYFTFSLSRVTKKFKRKIATLALLIWSGSLLHNIATVYSGVVIAAVMPKGLATAASFTLAQYMTSIMQAPQRGIIGASMAPLSKSWKDKDFKKINIIYHRSSVNQLIFSAGIFSLIWLNFTDGVLTFHLQESYLDAKYVFLFLGLNCIIDMGTGLNAQIIATSTFWRFDFITGIVLLGISLPLTYLLTKTIGITGPAIATLFSFTVYNLIRYIFLLKKFDMQPFNAKTAYALLLPAADFFVCYYLFSNRHGYLWIIVRSLVFIAIYFPAVIYFKLSPDIMPVWQTIKKRLGLTVSVK
ncbi:MAG TPA: polysaccharide biosynthesis C-terminal domain-containing protein [Puia sp.]|nr:polysaccharide biosynthesis C-terminal domain-containing protein [Puia sp.]